jgi:hypothetical protein
MRLSLKVVTGTASIHMITGNVTLITGTVSSTSSVPLLLPPLLSYGLA